jgi:SecD/SecF fusion protein
VDQFNVRAAAKDATFQGIMDRVKALQAATPGLEFSNLQVAIGTNDITAYFPFVPTSGQLHPTTFILNQLQKDAAGKIKLGLDLQGGTSFLVAMDTNKLANPQDTSGAISQAVEVLRKRVDAFGVAEPLIQPVGGNEILIQLPGLSQAVKVAAQQQIQKAAYLEFRLVKEDSDEILRNGEPIPPGYELMRQEQAGQPGKPGQITEVVVKKKPENNLAGDIVKSSMVVRNNMGQPEIAFELNPDAAKRFGETPRTTSVIGSPSFWTANYIPLPIFLCQLKPAVAASPAASPFKRRRNWPTCCKTPCARR